MRRPGEGDIVRTTSACRETHPGSRGGGPPCPLRWTWIRKQATRWAAGRHGSAKIPAGRPAKHTRPREPTNRVAGGRTSVSAPLGMDWKSPAPMGSRENWIGRKPPPAERPTKDTIRRGPAVRPAARRVFQLVEIRPRQAELHCEWEIRSAWHIGAQRA